MTADIVIPTPRVVLTMIVKNEAHVLERCISSIRPLIDAWCIVDTGSIDGTQELARHLLSDLPGELHEADWRDFGHNRTQALALARGLGEFSLMIDADVECHIDPTVDLERFRRGLFADVYEVEIQDEIHYARPLLTSTRIPFRYRGVLHEFLDVSGAAVRGRLISEFHYHSNFDGARSRNPLKWLDDVALLERCLSSREDPDLAERYTFYLAQSLAAADRIDEAIEVYVRRAEMGGWPEEVYVALLRAALLRRRQGHDLAQVLDGLMAAHDVWPRRAEALCHAAETARLASRMPTAYMFAREAVGIERPPSGLFLEPDVYTWRSLYELSIAAWYVGAVDEGREATRRLLAMPGLPDEERRAVERNGAYYV